MKDMNRFPWQAKTKNEIVINNMLERFSLIPVHEPKDSSTNKTSRIGMSSWLKWIKSELNFLIYFDKILSLQNINRLLTENLLIFWRDNTLSKYIKKFSSDFIELSQEDIPILEALIIELSLGSCTGIKENLSNM